MSVAERASALLNRTRNSANRSTTTSPADGNHFGIQTNLDSALAQEEATGETIPTRKEESGDIDQLITEVNNVHLVDTNQTNDSDGNLISDGTIKTTEEQDNVPQCQAPDHEPAESDQDNSGGSSSESELPEGLPVHVSKQQSTPSKHKLKQMMNMDDTTSQMTSSTTAVSLASHSSALSTSVLTISVFPRWL